MRGLFLQVILSLVGSVLTPCSLASSGATHNTPLSVRMPNHGTVTAVTSLEDFMRLRDSASILNDPTITTDDVADEIAITYVDAMLRETDNADAAFKLVRIEATTLAVTPNSLSYLIANYNGGSPRLELVSDLTAIPCQAKCAIAIVAESHGEIHVLKIGAYANDFYARTARRLAVTSWLQHGSGGDTSDAGGRKFSVTAGIFYLINNILASPAFDTSATDTFRAFYRDGAGGWTSVSAQTTLDNTKYDDGDGTLGVTPNNAYQNYWVFMVFQNTVRLGVMYPQNTYNQLIDAQSEALPTTRPEPLAAFSLGRPIARVTVQQGTAEITEIAEPWSDKLIWE